MGETSETTQTLPHTLQNTMHTCEGCNRTFEKLDSFSRHQRRCASLKLKQALALETFQAELLNRENLPATLGTSSAEQAQHTTPTDLGINQHAGATPSEDRLEDTSFSGGEPMVTRRRDQASEVRLHQDCLSQVRKGNVHSLNLLARSNSNPQDRNILRPGSYQDEVPSMASVMGDNPAGQGEPHGARVPFRTKTNHFGIYRIFPSGKPSDNPDILYGDDHLSDSPGFQ